MYTRNGCDISYDHHDKLQEKVCGNRTDNAVFCIELSQRYTAKQRDDIGDDANDTIK